MKHTTNKNLNLPDYTDTIDIEQINANFKALDQQATSSALGLTKLYDGEGENADGAMTQKATTNALAGKAATGHNHTLDSLNGTLSLNKGGTGATTADAARAALKAAAEGHKHSVNDLTDTLPVTKGGTGATTAEAARTNLQAAAASHKHNLSDLNNPNANGTTAGLTKLYGETGQKTDGAMTQKATTDAFVKKSGDTMTGELCLPKGSYVFKTDTSSNGKAGYFKIATIKIIGTYADAPIIIEYNQRHTTNKQVLSIRFESENSMDPTLKSFTRFGGKRDSLNQIHVYIKKSTTSTWDLYIQKTEPYGAVIVTSVEYFTKFFEITWMHGYVDNVSDATEATVAELVGTVDAANKLATGRKISIAGGATGTTSANFDGSADATINVIALNPAQLSTAVPVTKGGTGATDVATARMNLSAVAKVGDTMTGNLQIQGNLYPSLQLKPTNNATTYVSVFEGSYAGATSFSANEDAAGSNRRMIEVRNAKAQSSLDNAVVLRNFVSSHGTDYRIFHAGMTTPVPVTNGGTGATTAEQARQNLGITASVKHIECGQETGVGTSGKTVTFKKAFSKVPIVTATIANTDISGLRVKTVTTASFIIEANNSNRTINWIAVEPD